MTPCLLRPTPARPTSWSWRPWPMLAGLLLLVACGGGGGNAPTPVEPEEPIVRPVGPGELREATRLGRITAAEIAQAVQAAGERVPEVTPRYAVTTYRLNYLTIGADGRQLTASGLVAVPDKPAGARSPVMSYQHGTIFRDAEAPSNHAVAEEPAVVMASLGYVVLAADYLGYGASRGVPHPYLQAGPAAAAVLDLLTAAKYWRQLNRVADNGQLFLVGYSEGGHATLAAHRALQAGSHPQKAQLVGSVAGGGPYQVQATMDALLGLVAADNPLIAALLRPGTLKGLNSTLRLLVRNQLLDKALPDDADVAFDPRFIDLYLADDNAGLDTLSNVHDWAPQRPVRLFHGREDRTVPYASASTALAAMQARGAGAQVTLTDCAAVPAGHLECVLPYWRYMLEQLARVATDL